MPEQCSCTPLYGGEAFQRDPNCPFHRAVENMDAAACGGTPALPIRRGAEGSGVDTTASIGQQPALAVPREVDPSDENRSPYCWAWQTDPLDPALCICMACKLWRGDK